MDIWKIAMRLPAALVAGLLLASPASAAPKCFGKAPTIVGTSGKDTLIGTNGRDVIVGLGGNDVIVGKNENDRLCGNGGQDEISGGDDADKLSGGPGKDLLGGDVDRDVVKGDGGNDVLYGGRTNDVVRGGGGNDILFGNESHDSLLGGGGGDVLLGQESNDALKGGPGPDTASFYFSKDDGITVDLAAGTATGEGADTLDSIEGVEASGTTSGDDQLFGSAGVNWFWPYGGNDAVDGRGAFDVVSYFDASNGMAIDLAAGTASGDGSDSLTAIEGAFGSPTADGLAGTEGHNHLVGLKGNDNLFGRGGDDYLDGGASSFDYGDGGDGTDGCVNIEQEEPGTCELDTHPRAMGKATGSSGGVPRHLPGWLRPAGARAEA